MIHKLLEILVAFATPYSILEVMLKKMEHNYFQSTFVQYSVVVNDFLGNKAKNLEVMGH